MPLSESFQALRKASPHNRPGFQESVEQFDKLRTEIAATPVAPRRSPRELAHRRRLIGVSAAGAVLTAAAVLTGVMLSGGSTESAYAAANKAVAATSASALDSGTMTIKLTHDGAAFQSDTTRWNGDNLTLTLTGNPDYNEELRLVGQDAYVLRSEDGRWTHYDMTEPGPGKKLVEMLAVARADVAGTTVSDVIALATGLQKTERADGSTVYTGIVKAGTAAGELSNASSAIGTIAKASKVGLDVTIELVAGNDGLVDQVSASYQHDGGTWTWVTDYSGLGSTPTIVAPDASKVVEAEPVEKTTGTVPGQTTTAS